MSPISREREYARRRYNKWQTKQVSKYQQRRQRRTQLQYAGSAAAAVAVLVAAGLVFDRDSSPATTAAAASPEASASVDAANPCPVPTVKPPAEPQQFAAAPAASLAKGKSWTMTVDTSCGPIVATLFGDKAPQAVSNTIFLSGKKFWDGSPCHRLTTEGIYVLQCGDPTGSGSGGPGYSFGPVENAPKDGVYPAGTLAMARTSDENGNGSQFFVVYDETQLPGGYTVFGSIDQGLDIVQKVADGGSEPSGDGAPVRPISIVSTTVEAG